LIQPRLAELRKKQMQVKTSLKISHVSWGKIQVVGLGDGWDFKLWPGGGRYWDWNETGTHHAPGIQLSDVEELLENGARTVVLSCGMNHRLQICPETIAFLKRRGVEYHVGETQEAVTLYNLFVDEERKVGGLFHSTC
jgi:hypothetical protein